MFNSASAFDQDIGAWNVETSMHLDVHSASVQ